LGSKCGKRHRISVGVAEREADEKLEELNEELEKLNTDAKELEVRISENVERLLDS